MSLMEQIQQGMIPNSEKPLRPLKKRTQEVRRQPCPISTAPRGSTMARDDAQSAAASTGHTEAYFGPEDEEIVEQYIQRVMYGTAPVSEVTREHH